MGHREWGSRACTAIHTCAPVFQSGDSSFDSKHIHRALKCADTRGSPLRKSDLTMNSTEWHTGIRMLIKTPGDSSQGCDPCMRTSQIRGSSRSGLQPGDPAPDCSRRAGTFAASGSLWSAGRPPFSMVHPCKDEPLCVRFSLTSRTPFCCKSGPHLQCQTITHLSPFGSSGKAKMKPSSDSP